MNRRNCKTKRYLLIFYFSTFFFNSVGINADAATNESKVTLSETQQLGEKIYRQGILPSGQPMQAFVKGDISVPGTSFSCVSCHLRSGLGSFEGGVITPPTNGAKLFQPFGMSYKKVAVEEKYYPAHQQRSAYTDKSLAAALRGGVNASGQIMNPVMPRYQLQDGDMDLLITYLKSLSASFSPGVSDTELRFATVITDDVRPDEYEAMLAPLEQYVRHKNNMVQLFKTQKRSERMAAVMLESSELMYKKMSLSRWLLKGPPETWRSQLEEYYRKEPVFALLGGISNGDWQPVHDFSEAHQIPSLFPQTRFPVVSASDWYTLYFSKGYYQEGEGIARYLNAKPETINGGKVLQLVRASREGKALSRGFMETWRELGHDAAVTIMINAGDTVSKEYLQQVLARVQPAVVLLWDGTAALDTLNLVTTDTLKPKMVVLSSTYLGDRLWSIADGARDVTYITYPYRLPQGEERFRLNMEAFKTSSGTSHADETGLKQTYITTQILTQALMDLRGNYYRDNFFDVIGMIKDQELPLYERLSFGPGQRYASKGCYIVQLGKGTGHDLIRKSDWVIH